MRLSGAVESLTSGSLINRYSTTGGGEGSLEASLAPLWRLFDASLTQRRRGAEDLREKKREEPGDSIVFSFLSFLSFEFLGVSASLRQKAFTYWRI
jgi:hypothetical protein